MENSRKLVISEANNRLSKQWVTSEITWSEFVDRLGKPKVTAETLDEFLSYSKSKQDDIKDVGGFVGGKLKGNLRRNGTVESRSLITLDLDNLAYEDDTKIIKTLNGLGCAYVVYSTRKHQTTKPRIRVIFPLAEDVSADEYEPIARKVASFIGLRYCDPTTFQAVRLMYWPSHSIDSDYVFTYADKPMLDGAAILNMYDNWKDNIQYSADGMKALSTLSNIILILRNDKELKFKIFKDIFSSRILVRDGVPWDRKFETPDRIWTDTDDAGLRWYLESNYGITSTNKIIDGVNLIAEENAENKVTTRLQSTQWDGEKRLETLFIDYLGCEDNVYTREVAEKSLVAAVRRAIFGGIKWDNMPILIGPQGVGKSTFLKILGMDWYNDSLVNVEGKDACEIIQGSWILEMGELSSLRKSELNLVKNFLSRTDDIFRASYGRRAQKYPRRCAFFGTANDTNFLRDETGNRRFWPIDCFIHSPIKSIFNDLNDELDQIWAEACELAKNEFYSLVLSKEAEKIAKEEQEAHSEDNVYKGIILDYLDKKIPNTWESMDLFSRRTYLNEFETMSKQYDENDLILRDKICAAEIWEEALKMDIRYLKKSDSIEINKILSTLHKWEKLKQSSRFGKYGVQKGFKRKI